MITLEADRLHFRFPEVHENARCSVSFQRTLRIPDDGAPHHLPPGLGNFPLRHVDDYKSRLPAKWLRRGGVLMPMHQAEAMWISFGSGFSSRGPDYPFAVKIATGKVCAVTGDNWTEHLNQDPQDYVVLPEQPWIDGYCVEKGEIRQFIAMPLGEGYTVEEQITGAAEHGGIQIIAYPMKAERYEAILAEYRARYRGVLRSSSVFDADSAVPSPGGVYQSASMGLAPGGRMRQEIYDDRLRPRRVGPAPREPVFRDDRQFRAVDGDDRGEAPDHAADGKAVRRAPGCRGSTTTTGTPRRSRVPRSSRTSRA